MLTDYLQQLTREAGGDNMLLDARRHRGLIGDAHQVTGVMKNLRNAGFTRLIDFTGTHLGAKDAANGQLVEQFQMSLVLRAPEHGHAHLVLKWNWPPTSGVAGDFSPPTVESRTEVRPTHQEADTRSAPTGPPSAPATGSGVEEKPEPPAVDPDLARLGVTAHEIGPEEPEAELPGGNGDGLPPRPEAPEPGYNSGNGAGQPGGEPLQAGPVAAHPSLSHIWPAAGLAEREIWEMLGIPFSGHDNLAPLLLDEQFVEFPLRRDYKAPARPSYAAELLRERHEQALLGAVEQAADVGAKPRFAPGDEGNQEGRSMASPLQEDDQSGGEE